MDEPLLLNWYDVTLLIIICIGAIKGWITGLSAQLSRLIGMVVVLLFVLFLRPWAMGTLEASTTLPNSVIPPVAVLGLFAAGLAITAILRLLIGAVVQIRFAPWAERLGGFAGGALQMVFFLFAFTLVIQMIPATVIKTHTRTHSVLGNFCHRSASAGWRNLVETHPEVEEWAEQWPVPVKTLFEEEEPDASEAPDTTEDVDITPSDEASFLDEIEDVLPPE